MEPMDFPAADTLSCCHENFYRLLAARPIPAAIKVPPIILLIYLLTEVFEKRVIIF
jgi:hypothetical protein